MKEELENNVELESSTSKVIDKSVVFENEEFDRMMEETLGKARDALKTVNRMRNDPRIPSPKRTPFFAAYDAGLLTVEAVKREFALNLQKKSKLSASQRAVINGLVMSTLAKMESTKKTEVEQPKTEKL
jgi:hypothetical protein